MGASIHLYLINREFQAHHDSYLTITNPPIKGWEPLMGGTGEGANYMKGNTGSDKPKKGISGCLWAIIILILCIAVGIFNKKSSQEVSDQQESVNTESTSQVGARQPPKNLQVGEMVDLCGTCDLLYEVPIRTPLEVRHRIGEVQGNREAMIMMAPLYLDDIDMWFVKVDLGNNIFGWVLLSCINEDC